MKENTSGQPVSRILSGARGRFTPFPASSLLRAWATIYLRHASRHAWCSLPGTALPRGEQETSRLLRERLSRARIVPAWPCSRRGLPGRQHYCRRRWSLTPPFHPCWGETGSPRRYVSVARSGELPRPGGYPAPCSVECGLSSTSRQARKASLHAKPRPPGRPEVNLSYYLQGDLSICAGQNCQPVVK